MQTKLPETQGSLFWEMRKLALEKQAIDMSVGMVEFDCPRKLSDLAARYIQSGHNNYSPSEGIMPLRERVSEYYLKHYGKFYSPEMEITICSGVVQAVTSVITALINEGDEVIVFDPSYITYNSAIRVNGGVPVHVSLKEPGFRIDWEDTKKMVTSKTKMIILNTPHNPTGSVFGTDDLINLQKLTNGTGIYVLSDESFERLAFDDQKHQSVALFEALAARSFIVSSPGSMLHINGWCLAWCLAPRNLTTELRKIQEHQIFSSNTPLQYALSDFMEEETGFAEEVTEFYQGKRNYFNRLLKGTPFVFQPTQGTYFQLVNYQQLSKEADFDFARRLINEAGVAATPLSVFTHKKRLIQYLRFCFAKKNETLEEVARRLTLFAENNGFVNK